MALKDEIVSRLVGTLQTFFKIANIRLKNNSGVLEIRNDGDTAFSNVGTHTVRVHGSNASNGVSLTAPGALSGNVSLTLPNSAGSSNQVLRTDGSGVLSWVDVVANANLLQVETFTQATGSPLSIFTPPSGSRIISIAVDVTVAAGAGIPTIEIGTAADTNAYTETTDTNLRTLATYIVYPYITVVGAPDAVIASITPDSQTFSGTVFIEYSTPA